jgi:hypothetical protein
MSLKDRAHTRAEAAEEARHDAEQEARLEEQLSRWKRRAAWLGIALALSIATIVPFADGQPLHRYWGNAKFVVYLAMCLLSAFMYALGTAYVVWNYLRSIRAIHKFAPPGSQYRQGK